MNTPTPSRAWHATKTLAFIMLAIIAVPIAIILMLAKIEKTR